MTKQLLYNECTFGKPETDAVMKMFKLGWLSGGEETANFEKEFAEWVGVDYMSLVNSGSSANYVALAALDLKKGDEVITAACGFPTTVSPILLQGFIPVYVDVDMGSWTINLDQLEKAIGPKTKAVMFAHTLGNMPDMDRLMRILKKHNLKYVEDTCDALGSTFGGKMAGTFGDVATVSFYPAHHMTTAGECVGVFTNNIGVDVRAKSLRDWGKACYCKWNESNPCGACGTRFSNPPFDHKYYYTRLGLNFKASELQAAFGREQLKRLDGFIDKRKRNFKILYNELVKDKYWRTKLPKWHKKADISWFCFTLQEPKIKTGSLNEYLERHHIQTRALFAGNLLAHPAFKNQPGRIAGDLSVSDYVLGNVFFVGVGPKLTPRDMMYIAKTIRAYK
jgi:CDP-6-deoxy-D-xylo-4-hexulose-3-dehydrase